MILPQNRCGQGPPGPHNRPGGYERLRPWRLRRRARGDRPGPGACPRI